MIVFLQGAVLAGQVGHRAEPVAEREAAQVPGQGTLFLMALIDWLVFFSGG
jgi:hypothetical protein